MADEIYDGSPIFREPFVINNYFLTIDFYRFNSLIVQSSKPPRSTNDSTFIDFNLIGKSTLT